MAGINRCLFLDAEHNLRIEERDIPKPKKGELLIKIEKLSEEDYDLFQEESYRLKGW